MCGIAGLIHRGKSSNVGSELQGMLQALKHRGEDSLVTLCMEIQMAKTLLCVLKLEKMLVKEVHQSWKMFQFMMREKK